MFSKFLHTLLTHTFLCCSPLWAILSKKRAKTFAQQIQYSSSPPPVSDAASPRPSGSCQGEVIWFIFCRKMRLLLKVEHLKKLHLDLVSKGLLLVIRGHIRYFFVLVLVLICVLPLMCVFHVTLSASAFDYYLACF